MTGPPRLALAGRRGARDLGQAGRGNRPGRGGAAPPGRAIADKELDKRAAAVAHAIFREIGEGVGPPAFRPVPGTGDHAGPYPAREPGRVPVGTRPEANPWWAMPAADRRPWRTCPAGPRMPWCWPPSWPWRSRSAGTAGVLVLDDPFLAMDRQREERALRMLQEFHLRHGWQIILLTKDAHLRDGMSRLFPELKVLDSPRLESARRRVTRLGSSGVQPGMTRPPSPVFLARSGGDSVFWYGICYYKATGRGASASNGCYPANEGAISMSDSFRTLPGLLKYIERNFKNDCAMGYKKARPMAEDLHRRIRRDRPPPVPGPGGHGPQARRQGGHRRGSIALLDHHGPGHPRRGRHQRAHVRQHRPGQPPIRDQGFGHAHPLRGIGGPAPGHEALLRQPGEGHRPARRHRGSQVHLLRRRSSSWGRPARPAIPGEYLRLSEGINEQDTATIIYTSGSTGIPKGRRAHPSQPGLPGPGRRQALSPGSRPRISIVSCLPLAHVFERMVGYYYLSTRLQRLLRRRGEEGRRCPAGNASHRGHLGPPPAGEGPCQVPGQRGAGHRPQAKLALAAWAPGP